MQLNASTRIVPSCFDAVVASAVVLTVRNRVQLVCQPLEDLNGITREEEEERLAGVYQANLCVARQVDNVSLLHALGKTIGVLLALQSDNAIPWEGQVGCAFARLIS